MEVEELLVPRQEIESELEHLKQAIKEGYISKRTNIARDLMAVYGHVQHGGKIIDLHKTFASTGINEEGHPKLAIVPFSAKFAYLYKKKSGGAIFSSEPFERWDVYANKTNGDVELPADTFVWSEKTTDTKRRWKTVAPIVPPRVLTIASAKLTPQHYHILFEADEWTQAKPAQPPDDPILGKMLTPNIFGVIATWELTELEKTIIKGRL